FKSRAWRQTWRAWSASWRSSTASAGKASLFVEINDPATLVENLGSAVLALDPHVP
ncbi:unnamed protein product, partial [Ascophyllum nodosum]